MLSCTVTALWREVLGDGADTDASFIAAGGDSFQAVVLAMRVHEEVGSEIDYLDVLQAETCAAVVRAVRAVGL